MNPFDIHSEQSPHCQFIHSIKLSSTTTSSRNTLTLDGRQNPSKRQKIETTDFDVQTNTSIEADPIKQARKRTFSHWPHRYILSGEQMTEAGFFNCNVGDRVICIYCNVIYHRWTENVYNPSEVHKRLSPDCPYVKANLINDQPPLILNLDQSSASTTSVPFSERLRPIQQKKNNHKIRKPVTISSTSSTDNNPSINDLIVGGFLDADIRAIEDCVSCKKSLQNTGDDGDPMNKKAHWLLHCVHSKLDDEDELYHKSEGPRRSMFSHYIFNKKFFHCFFSFRSYSRS